MRQTGDPGLNGENLVFGCIHGDECAASGIQPRSPLTAGCPDPKSDVYVVPNLNPDGAARGSRLNGRGVDLNRNFPAGWKSIGSRGDPQYSGPRPFSEPETRLAARIVRRLRTGGDDLVPPAPGPATVRPCLGPERTVGARVRAPGEAAVPAPTVACGDGAELAEPSLPGHQLVRRRAAAGTAGGRPRRAPRRLARPPRAAGERMRCPAEEVRLGHEGGTVEGVGWREPPRPAWSESSSARRSGGPATRSRTSTRPTGGGRTAPPTSSCTTPPRPRTSPRTPFSRRSTP